jgi:GDP-L-fucose synthase
VILRSREELDLTVQPAVDRFFDAERPEYVFLAAARTGGILANSIYPAQFIRDNLLIQTHTIDAAYRAGVRKLLFLGSSCIYPKFAPQPLKEEYLLSGQLEPTNEPYAVAKIAGVKMCQAYRLQYGFNAISLMPTNLYGPGDNFALETSHVLPALIRRFHEAKASGARTVVVWGTGKPCREFLHVEDLADACVFLMSAYDQSEIINVGVGNDVSIRELSELVAAVVGFSGEIVYDPSKPDGTPRKLLDVSRLTTLGWKAKIPLERGIEETYRWYRERALIGGAR